MGPYFRQYYFLLYLIIVAFGWINGVIFQPILLSWFPPTPFVKKQEENEENLNQLGIELQPQSPDMSPTAESDEAGRNVFSKSIDYTNDKKDSSKFNSRES